MVTDLIRLGIGVTLALLGNDMNQHGPTITVGSLEGPHHFTDVMAINRPHVGEAQLFKHSTHLGNRETTHTSLQAVQLGWELATHEGKMANAFLNTAGEELHRRTEPCAVQNVRQGTHRGGDRHVVVVEDNEQGGFGEMSGVVDRFQSHPTGKSTIADHGDALEVLTTIIPGHRHAQRCRNRRAGMASTEMIKVAF